MNTPTIATGPHRPQTRPLAWFCLALAILAPFCNAYDVFGRVVGVTDGDTLTVLDPQKYQHKIRLYGIDAPEKAQPFGTVAKQDLSALAFGKGVRVEVTARDRYGREIGKVYVLIGDWYKPEPGEIVPREIYANHQLLQQGSAWHYTQYPEDIDLTRTEKVARAAKLGLWGIGTPIAPWNWRKGVRAGAVGATPSVSVTTKATLAPDDVVFITRTGKKYHRDGCRWLRSRIQSTRREAEGQRAGTVRHV